MERDAVISDCGRYRYMLRRAWNYKATRALFVMLNPSTADAEIDDATIRSCLRLCKSWGYGSFEVINLFGFRATDPKDLAKAEEPVGSQNEVFAMISINRCDVVICAWGAHAMAVPRAGAMYDMVHEYKPAVFCLGTTKNGAPKHPLYIKTGTNLETWSPR